MKRAQKIAEENRKREICMTYDLAIAKIALQLQEGRFQNVIMFLLFLVVFTLKWQHSQFLENTLPSLGGPDILNECHIIEKRFLKSFISEKGYKRTKKAH